MELNLTVVSVESNSFFDKSRVCGQLMLVRCACISFRRRQQMTCRLTDDNSTNEFTRISRRSQTFLSAMNDEII